MYVYSNEGGHKIFGDGYMQRIYILNYSIYIYVQECLGIKQYKIVILDDIFGMQNKQLYSTFFFNWSKETSKGLFQRFREIIPWNL